MIHSPQLVPIINPSSRRQTVERQNMDQLQMEIHEFHNKTIFDTRFTLRFKNFKSGFYKFQCLIIQYFVRKIPGD